MAPKGVHRNHHHRCQNQSHCVQVGPQGVYAAFGPQMIRVVAEAGAHHSSHSGWQQHAIGWYAYRRYHPSAARSASCSSSLPVSRTHQKDLEYHHGEAPERVLSEAAACCARLGPAIPTGRTFRHKLRSYLVMLSKDPNSSAKQQSHSHQWS